MFILTKNKTNSLEFWHPPHRIARQGLLSFVHLQASKFFLRPANPVGPLEIIGLWDKFNYILIYLHQDMHAMWITKLCVALIWFAKPHLVFAWVGHELRARDTRLLSHCYTIQNKKNIAEQGRTPGRIPRPLRIVQIRGLQQRSNEICTVLDSTKEPWTHIPTHKECPYIENLWKECEIVKWSVVFCDGSTKKISKNILPFQPWSRNVNCVPVKIQLTLGAVKSIV